MSRELVEVTTPVFEGLQVIVALNCRMRSRVNGCAPFDIVEPGAYVVLASGRHEGHDRIEPHALQRFVRIGIDPESADRNGFDLARIARSGRKRLFSNDIIVMHQPLTPALKAIATQALACPLQGAMRDVFLAGKGLELAAFATDAILSCGEAGRCRLTGADLERMWHARELALQHYQQPLTLHELARQVGTNVNKLTFVFRQVFGKSVFEYIQHHRLQEAYRMLATGAYSVSEVATFVGYAIPHFSTTFRKHFGFSPSQLVH
ncbi:MAG: AraC family transcriptional regulator [Rhodocyclaceae bacterium]